MAVLLGLSLAVLPEPFADTPEAKAQGSLVGTFGIDAGACPGGSVFVRHDDPSFNTTGSWFQMIGQDGNPFLNGSSPCIGVTPLRPGNEGGLITGSFQPLPDPAFDAVGNCLANRIHQPETFFGAHFSDATNQTDPQGGENLSAFPPTIEHDGAGNLSGDMRAWAACWNFNHFNQGSPKPDGSFPCITSGDCTEGPSGTLDLTTCSYNLQWSSRIVGGPFNGNLGVWHLEGTYTGGGCPAVQESSQADDDPTGGGGTTVGGDTTTGGNTTGGGDTASEIGATGGPSTGVGSLAPAVASIPAWAVVATGLGGAGLTAIAGTAIARTLRRKR
ncbi:MAG: hypothetical protein ACE5KW_01890 [Dehalococcoidia bacterium]